MVWEWQAWRCFDDFTEELWAGGWEPGFRGDELPAVLGWSEGYCIVFRSRNPATGECWFELRGEGRAVAVRGIPAVEASGRLLSEYGVPLAATTGAPSEKLPVVMQGREAGA